MKPLGLLAEIQTFHLCCYKSKKLSAVAFVTTEQICPMLQLIIVRLIPLSSF